MTPRASDLLVGDVRPREPLKCKIGPGDKGPGCGHPVQISHVQYGYAVVQPGEWFVKIPRDNWFGICPCRKVRRDSEWNLYRALGWA